MKEIPYKNIVQLRSYYNTYIIEEEKGLILVDTGIEGEENGILHAIDKLKKPLLFIALTHAHFDHVGGTKEVLARHPEAKVCIGKKELEAVEGERVYHDQEGKPYEILISPSPFPVSCVVKEGDRLSSLCILETPGHTPGSVSYLHEDTGTLFVGDALVSVGKLKVAGQANPTFPLPSKGTWDTGKALESCRKMLSYSVQCLACGHGRMLMNPEEKMKELLPP